MGVAPARAHQGEALEHAAVAELTGQEAVTVGHESVHLGRRCRGGQLQRPARWRNRRGLPAIGDLATVADLVVSLLGPYFDPIT